MQRIRGLTIFRVDLIIPLIKDRACISSIFELLLCVMKLDDAATHLEALGNPTRLKIYRALIRAGGAGLAVGRLQEKLKIAPSTLSHHIKSLVVVGLVTQERDATTLICHANYQVMRELLGFLAAECCAESAETAEAKRSAKSAA